MGVSMCHMYGVDSAYVVCLCGTNGMYVTCVCNLCVFVFVLHVLCV